MEPSLPPPLLPPPPPPPPPAPLPLLRLLRLRLPLSLLEDGVAGRGTRRGRLPAVVARLGVDLYPAVGREGPATAGGGLVPTPMVGPPEAAAGDKDDPVPTPMRGLGDVMGGGEGVFKLRPPPPTPIPPRGGVTHVTY